MAAKSGKVPHERQVTKSPDEHRPRRGLFRSLAGVFVSGLMIVPNLFRERKPRQTDEVTVYSAHPAFYLWFLILAGFICSAIVNNFPAYASTVGWIYIWVLIYFIASLLYDFSIKKLSLWLGIILLVWLISKYIEHLRQVALLGYVVSYLQSMNPVLEPGTVTVVSWLLLIPWIGSLFEMALNRRKRFTPNEITEFHFGEGSELTDRLGLRFRTKYRDVLETVLGFGGGDLLAIDNRGNVIKHYENIIGLSFLWKRLDRILQQRATSIEDTDADDADLIAKN